MKTIFLWIIINFPILALAQSDVDIVSSHLYTRDSLFWITYNACTMDRMNEFITKDVEFYHDKGGIIKGLDSMITKTKRNLCSGKLRLRREEVKGTKRIDLLKENDHIYGAILSGEHFFYILVSGKSEVLDGHARYSHLWLKEGGNWKMSRIYSYDHKPAGKRP